MNIHSKTCRTPQLACAEVKGGDLRRSHDELNVLLNGMLKHAGFYMTPEARNMFQGKVAQHSTANEIIPDILIHNNITACLPAIIDLKTLRVDKNHMMYTPGIHGRG